MSLGFSPSDITLLATIVVKLCLNYRKSSSDFGKLTEDIKAFEIILNQAYDISASIPLDKHKRGRYRKLVAYSKGLLKDLNEYYKDYASLGSKTQRKRDKLRWRPSDAERLRGRIQLHSSLWSAHTSFMIATSLQETQKILTNLISLTQKHAGEPSEQASNANELSSTQPDVLTDDQHSRSPQRLEKDGAQTADISDDHVDKSSQDYNEPVEVWEEDDPRKIDELLRKLSIPAEAVPLDSVMDDMKEEANESLNRNQSLGGPQIQPHLTDLSAPNEAEQSNTPSADGVENDAAIPPAEPQKKPSKLSLENLGRSAPTFAEENSPFGTVATAACLANNP
ncbi:hypothetical protein MMC17_009931 [Xylographa soralifera]|nr:hypothetical protein [Xylographa soralifera]